MSWRLPIRYLTRPVQGKEEMFLQQACLSSSGLGSGSGQGLPAVAGATQERRTPSQATMEADGPIAAEPNPTEKQHPPGSTGRVEVGATHDRGLAR